MISLIITIVSIALVTLISIAAIFYGGPALNKSATLAQATESINQGNQVLAAMDLYRVDHGQYPASMNELVTQGYLTEIPTLKLSEKDFFDKALAQSVSNQWSIPVARLPVVWISVPSQNSLKTEICKAVNFKARKHNGILKRIQATPEPQCYGASSSDLRIVMSRSTLALEQVVSSDPQQWDPSGILPPDNDDKWFEPPTQGGVGPSNSNPPVTTSLGTLAAQSGLNFGSLSSGQSSLLSFVYSNTGTAALTGIQSSISSNPHLVLEANNCGTAVAPISLNPGQQCTFSVRYSPLLAETLTASVSVSSSATNSPVSLQLQGQASVSPPPITSTTASLTANTFTDFGTLTTGQEASLTFTYSNTGSIAATGVQAFLTESPYLTIQNNTCGTSLSPGTVNPGQNCAVTVRYAPLVAESMAETLTVQSSASNSPHSLALQGQAQAAITRQAVWSSQNLSSVVEPSLSYRTFDTSAVGQSQTKNFFFRSTGNSSISAGATITGDTQHFRINRIAADGYGLCFEGGSISNGGTVASPCLASQSTYPTIRVEITYAPQATGSHSITITPTTSNGTVLPTPIQVFGSANSTAVGVFDIESSLDPSDNSYTFPSQQVGTVSSFFATRSYTGPTTPPLLSLGGTLTGDTQHFSIRRITANSIGTCSNGGGTAFTSTNPTRTSVSPCLAYTSYPTIRVEIVYAPKSAGNHQVTFNPTTANGSALPAPTIYRGSAF